MRRLQGRRALAVLVAVTALLAGLAACTSGTAPSAAAGRPNIVFVLTDDLSSDLVRFMPHVQAMERAGETFSNYYVVDSLCCPSRSAIFTGQYPHNNGVFTNYGRDGGYGAFNRHGNETKSFAVGLQDAGYRTALLGKYLNGYGVNTLEPPGWTDWQVSGYGYGEFDYTLNDNGFIHHYGHQPADYLTDVLSQKAADFIDQTPSSKPFALEVATFSPHTSYIPAPRDAEKFPNLKAPRGPAWDALPTDAPAWLERPPLTKSNIAFIDQKYRMRAQAVQSVDRMIGHLEDVLRAKGELKNTYFVFSSDNGYHMGQYRLLPGKQLAFDTDIRVPLVVVGPGVPAGVDNSTMTSSIDLAPTFEQIGGAKQPDTPDGTSLLGLWHGQPPPPTWAHAVLIEHHGPTYSPADPDRQTAVSGNPPSYEAIRTASALYVEYDDGEREYYNLLRDPSELHNEATVVAPSVLAPLQTALHAMESCRGAAQCQAASQPAA